MYIWTWGNVRGPAVHPFPFGLIQSCRTKDEWNGMKWNGILYRKNFMHVNTSWQRHCRWQAERPPFRPSVRPSAGYPEAQKTVVKAVQQFLIHMFLRPVLCSLPNIPGSRISNLPMIYDARTRIPKWKSCPQLRMLRKVLRWVRDTIGVFIESVDMDIY